MAKIRSQRGEALEDLFRLQRKTPGPWHVVDREARGVIFAKCGLYVDARQPERTDAAATPVCKSCRRSYSPWQRRLDAIADREP
jgi:hypothetical protein